MFHVSKHTDSADMSLLGKFILATVLSDDGNSLTLDTPITRVFDVAKLSKYSCQIISIAQFGNLTINYNYSATTKWDDNRKIGGICAIACNGTLDIRDGQINVESKGGGSAYEREGLAFIGNAQMCDILPLGQGHGSVFLIAKKIDSNKNSRIGATYNGSVFGGWDMSEINTGGYQGLNSTSSVSHAGYGRGGSGNDGGSQGSYGTKGGYGSNSDKVANTNGITYTEGKQGAHLFLITDNSTNFNLAMISTGGGTTAWTNSSGGAGYGGSGITSNANPKSVVGAGGYNGGGGWGGNYGGSGGGSSGWAFIYANEVTEFNNTGVAV